LFHFFNRLEKIAEFFDAREQLVSAKSQQQRFAF
jgi:hypothetical protein